MRRAGNIAILTYDDIAEGLLSGQVLTLPDGVRRLMIIQDAVDRLNHDLWFYEYPADEEDEA
jgi:hypothetical protein